MIKISDILRAIADAIEADASVKKICERWANGYRLIVGHVAQEDLQAEDDRIVISIGFAGDYDLGYVQERTAPVTIRVAAWCKETHEDGVREEYIGSLDISDLCHEISEAIKNISGMGDDLLSASVQINTDAWPHVVGTITASITWPVGLNQEATL
jgi:hypothetical protein